MSHPQELATTTLLSTELERRLERALSDSDHLVRASSAEDFRLRAAAAFDDVAVLEPGHDVATPLCDGHQWMSRIPVIAYTRLSPRAIAATLVLTQSVAAEVNVLIAGYNDSPSTLRSRLSTVAASSSGVALYNRLEPFLAEIPGPVRLGISEFCRTATPRDGVKHLAMRCATSRAGLARWLARCGIHSAHTLVIGARLVRGYDCLMRGDVPLKVTAAALCLGTVATLREHVRRVSGLSLEEVRGANDFDGIVARIAASITGTSVAERAAEQLARPQDT